MMRSLYSGVSGLKNHQTRMDVVGNNISNVNTTGFKSSRVTFSDTLSQTLSGASAPVGDTGGTNPKQIGLGSGISSIDTLFTDGSVQNTGKNTDLCLSGNGLFVVKPSSLKENAEVYYTRNGAFEFDAKGNFVMPGSGMFVVGWKAEDGVIKNPNESNMGVINIPAGQTMGAARLGKLIEQYGSAEGFGIGFIDDKEIWYLENACGHKWLACRMPKDQYFVTGNQSRFRDYAPEDKENFMAAPDLIEFAEKNGLYDPNDAEAEKDKHGKAKFDFHKAYSRDEELDTTYNYPRVWGLQQMFSPAIQNDVTKNTFPVFAKAAHKISLTDLRTAFRFHYDHTDHDPYLHENGKEPYRPVSIFRTTQTHIIQVRENLPHAIGHIIYVAFGMGDLSVFLPLYQGVKTFPELYTHVANGRCKDNSAYWRFRGFVVD